MKQFPDDWLEHILCVQILHVVCGRLAALPPPLFKLYSDEHAGVAVVRQQRVLAAPSLRVLDVGPAAHEVAVGHDAGELAGDGAVHGLGDVEVSREEDIEVALVDLDILLAFVYG